MHSEITCECFLGCAHHNVIKMAMASGEHTAAKVEKLQYQLEGFIENLRTVGVIAGDFQQNGQNNFNEKL